MKSQADSFSTASWQGAATHPAKEQAARIGEIRSETPDFAEHQAAYRNFLTLMKASAAVSLTTLGLLYLLLVR